MTVGPGTPDPAHLSPGRGALESPQRTTEEQKQQRINQPQTNNHFCFGRPHVPKENLPALAQIN